VVRHVRQRLPALHVGVPSRSDTSTPYRSPCGPRMSCQTALIQSQPPSTVRIRSSSRPPASRACTSAVARSRAEARSSWCTRSITGSPTSSSGSKPSTSRTDGEAHVTRLPSPASRITSLELSTMARKRSCWVEASRAICRYDWMSRCVARRPTGVSDTSRKRVLTPRSRPSSSRSGSVPISSQTKVPTSSGVGASTPITKPRTGSPVASVTIAGCWPPGTSLPSAAQACHRGSREVTPVSASQL